MPPDYCHSQETHIIDNVCARVSVCAAPVGWWEAARREMRKETICVSEGMEEKQNEKMWKDVENQECTEGHVILERDVYVCGFVLFLLSIWLDMVMLT